ncbi:tetratricopeptide repeat protein [Flammeovirga agarivorans]|uniref:Tetratricopeptide repeat protein n=1 Tax=Flammeovirga agarivorans TaxID=2726742 RepID=A0A7X8SRT0_9BACT|nr:tetratricopeptide repeat protein [Flammeovirga agarivorans]NLR95079.1 tetratricopeptide repeat protein [Flammeovirga agarivorans]
MNEQYNINDIRQLENGLTKNPNDTDLINKLAIGYLSCREADSFNKVDGLLKKAFEIKPSIKTANNYAYQIITDWDDYERGIEILQPFIDKEPKSYMPYNLIGYAYLMKENYEKAKFYFEKALTLSQTEMVEIIHNLAVCENYLDNPQKALTLYDKSIELMDKDNESKFNKAVCQIELGLTSEIDQIIQKIRKSESYKDLTAWVSCTDLSQLCYLNNDLKQAYDILMESPNFDLQSYPEFCYLLLKYNDSKFNELAEEEVESKKSWIADLNDPEDEEYEDYTEQERLAEIKKLNEEIEIIRTLRQKLINPPEIKPSELYKTIFCGCLFYDCKIHGTQFDE